jgi:hypothetical protein
VEAGAAADGNAAAGTGRGAPMMTREPQILLILLLLRGEVVLVFIVRNPGQG